MIDKIIFIIIVILIILFLIVCCCKFFCINRNIYITGGTEYRSIREIMEEIDLTLVLLNKEGTKALITNINYLFEESIIYNNYGNILDEKRQETYVEISKENIDNVMPQISDILTNQNVYEKMAELKKDFEDLDKNYASREMYTDENARSNAIRRFYTNYKGSIDLTSFRNDFIKLIIDKYFQYWRNKYEEVKKKKHSFKTKYFIENIYKFAKIIPKTYYDYIRSKLNDEKVLMNQRLKDSYKEIDVFLNNNAKTTLQPIESLNKQLIDLSSCEFTRYDEHIPDTNYEENNFYLCLKYDRENCALRYTILTENEYFEKSLDPEKSIIKIFDSKSYVQLYVGNNTYAKKCTTKDYHSMSLSFNRKCYKILTELKESKDMNGSLIISFNYDPIKRSYKIEGIVKGQHKGEKERKKR